MLERRKIEPNLTKLRAVVHYVCYRKRDQPTELSKTKLHKILFYSDMESYLDRKEPITGEEYIKHQFGPYSTHLDAIIEELEGAGCLVTSQKEFDIRGNVITQNLYFCAKEPDLSVFTAEEVSLLDEWIDKICRLTAQQVSELSHDIVWESRQKLRCASLGSRRSTTFDQGLR